MPTSLEALKQQLYRVYDRSGTYLDQSRGGRFVLDIVRGSVTVVHHMRSVPVLERAAALSYGTVLSVVPLLAVVLAIVNAVGHALLRERVHDAILTFLAPGIQASSQQYLENLITRATSGGIVSLSGGALLFSAVMLLRSVESTLNSIWGVESLRDWRIRIPVYLLILMAGPVLLGLSLAATAAASMVRAASLERMASDWGRAEFPQEPAFCTEYASRAPKSRMIQLR